MAQLFDAIARAITSLAAVVFVMLMTITGMIFFSHTLFASVFPDTMSTWEKAGATWVLAMAWELTVLITTCNTRHINARIPVVMALCSGVIILFFLQGFEASAGFLMLLQRWFVGALVATINYIYAELFYKKWSERVKFIEQPDRVDELERQLIEAQAAVQSTINERESAVNELQRALNEAQSALDERQSAVNEVSLKFNQELDELRAFRTRVQSELTCPHCAQIFPAYGTLHAHKGHCPENPKTKPKH